MMTENIQQILDISQDRVFFPENPAGEPRCSTLKT